MTLSLRERVIESYSSTSAWHQPLAKRDVDRFARTYRYYLRDWLPTPAPGDRWLDVGCGQGALLHLAREAGYEPRGVDASPEMLVSCRALGLDVDLGDVFEYLRSLPTGAFRVVSAFDVLEHFPKEEGLLLLSEMRRVLRPDGTCLLKLPNAASPMGFAVTASDLTHEAAYSVFSLRQLGVLAGFQRFEAREVGPAPVSLRGRIRHVLWGMIRAIYGGLTVVETGSRYGGVYTQVMLAKLSP